MATINEHAIDVTASFTTHKINRTTFVVHEDDQFGEKPLIYVKFPPGIPLVILSDTGCDAPSKKCRNARFTHLRDYLENCPVTCNDNKALNPKGELPYHIIITHCHFDHTLGLPQFVKDSRTRVIASAAGRNFVQSDLDAHGLFKYYEGISAPEYSVQHWAESFERLKTPRLRALLRPGEAPVTDDLGISIIHTPGHTPDELAWYDHHERHLYVGDSFYYEGDDKMPIEFPAEGSLVEWVFSMQKLLVFVRSTNAQAASSLDLSNDAVGKLDAGWVYVPQRVRVSCAHATVNVDAEEILAALEKFAARTYEGQVPLVKKEEIRDEMYGTWRDEEAGDYDDSDAGVERFSIRAPLRLMKNARRFFNL